MPQQRLARISNGTFSPNDKLILKGEQETFDENKLVPVEVKAGKIFLFFCHLLNLQNICMIR